MGHNLLVFLEDGLGGCVITLYSAIVAFYFVDVLSLAVSPAVANAISSVTTVLLFIILLVSLYFLGSSSSLVNICLPPTFINTISLLDHKVGKRWV